MARVFERPPKLHQSILYALRIDERSRKEVALQYGMSLRRVDRALAQALAYCAEQMGPGVNTVLLRNAKCGGKHCRHVIECIANAYKCTSAPIMRCIQLIHGERKYANN